MMKKTGFAGALALGALGAIEVGQEQAGDCCEATCCAETPEVRDRLELEFLFLDRTQCGRCTETEASLEQALALVGPVFEALAVDVSVRRFHVQTEEQARTHRLTSSPTLRVNGHDVALEFSESSCGDCGALCAEGTPVDCRVWMWQGQEYTAAPVGLIVDALLHGYAALARETRVQRPFELPENLQRFFAAKAVLEDAPREGKPCCEPEQCTAGTGSGG